MWATTLHCKLYPITLSSSKKKRLGVKSKLITPKAAQGRLRVLEGPGEGTSKLARGCNIDIEEAHPSFFRRHHLVRGEVTNEGEDLGPLVFCTKCYAYFHHGLNGLAGVCDGKPISSQCSRLQRELFPSGARHCKDWRVTGQRALRMDEAWRVQEQLRSAASFKGARRPREEVATATSTTRRRWAVTRAAGTRLGDWASERDRQEASENFYLATAGLDRERAEALVRKHKQARREARATLAEQRRANCSAAGGGASSGGSSESELDLENGTCNSSMVNDGLEDGADSHCSLYLVCVSNILIV